MQTIENYLLTLIDRLCLQEPPHRRFRHDGLERRLGPRDRALQGAEEPAEPRRHVKPASLALFENLVIGISVGLDLRGHAVETFRPAVRTRKRQLGDGAGDPAVAVFKGMNRHES